MDGWEFLSRIKQIPELRRIRAVIISTAAAELKRDPAARAIPIVALTALAMKGDEARIRAAGCDGYIAEPMRYQEFPAAIAAQLTRD